MSLVGAVSAEIERAVAALEHRPSLLVLLALVVGILLSSAPFWMSLVAAALVCGLLARCKAIRSWCIPVASFVVLGSLRALYVSTPSDDDVSKLAGAGYVVIEGVLDEPAYESGQTTTLVMLARSRASDMGVQYVSGLVQITVNRAPLLSGLRYGAPIRAEGLVRLPEPAANPGSLDVQAWLKRRGIFAIMGPRAARVSVLPMSDSELWHPSTLGPVARNSFRRSTQTLRQERPDEAALAEGIVLGGRVGLSKDLQDEFAITGTAHLLASSGMNLVIVAAMLTVLLPRLGIGRKPGLILQILVLAIYMFAAGATPSIVRAWMMVSLLHAAPLFFREPDLASAFAVSASVMLLLNPGDITSPGFVLSYVLVGWLAASGLGLFETVRDPNLPPVPRLTQVFNAFKRSLLKLCAATFIAQLAAAPIVAVYFNQVPVLGVLANLLAVPLVGVAMAVGFAAWFGGLASAGIGALLAHGLVGPVSGAILGIVHLFAAMPLASLPVAAPGWPAVVLYYVVLLAGLVMFRAYMSLRAVQRAPMGART